MEVNMRCPYCGSAHYIEKYCSTITFDDKDYRTYECYCPECKNEFSFTLSPDDYLINNKAITITAREAYEYKKSYLRNEIARLQQELQELEFNEPYIRGAGTGAE